MTIRTIAIMSPGNMGSAVGAFLGKAGFDVIADLTGRSDYTKGLAARAAMRDVASRDALVGEADLVLSILAPQLAVPVAREIAGAMGRTGCAPVYVDCNATAPATARELAAIIGGAGAAFIDVGIIGSAPAEGRAFPRFCASGPDAALLDVLDGNGVSILHVGPEIGQGSAIKICNGAFTKGAFALYTTVMMAAETFGFAEHLRPQLRRGQAGTAERLDDAVIRLPTLSGRYIGEMEQVAEAFADIGLTPGFHDAAADVFRLLAETPLAAQRREEIDPDRTSPETLRILVDHLRATRGP